MRKVARKTYRINSTTHSSKVIRETLVWILQVLRKRQDGFRRLHLRSYARAYFHNQIAFQHAHKFSQTCSLNNPNNHPGPQAQAPCRRSRNNPASEVNSTRSRHKKKCLIQAISSRAIIDYSGIKFTRILRWLFPETNKPNKHFFPLKPQ